MKLTLFERLILLVINEVMFLSGIPAKHREGLSCLLYKIGMSGEVTEADIKTFE